MNPGQRIFTQSRPEQITGRNANIQPMMLKRKQIFQKVPTQRHQTPFSGYSFSSSTVSDINSLAQSQVTEFSNEGIRKIVKQQIQRAGLNNMSQNSQQSMNSHKSKSDLLVFKTQMRAIKQNIHLMNKSIKQKFQENGNHLKEIHKEHLKAQIQAKEELKNQMYQQVSKMMKQYQKQTAVNLRKVVTKMHEDVRKQFVNYVGRQFIPLTFLDDLDKQLNDIQDRISSVQTKIDQKSGTRGHQNLQNSKIQKDQSTLSSASQLKLNKFERQLEYVKKVIQQKSQKIKQMDQLIVMGHQSKTRQIRDNKQKIQELNLLVKDTQLLTKSLREDLQDKIQKNKIDITKIIKKNLQNTNERFAQNLNISKKDNIQGIFNTVPEDTSILLQNTSGLMNDSSVQLYQQKKQSTNQRQSPKKQPSNKKITITYNNSQPQPQPLSSDKEITPVITNSIGTKIINQKGRQDQLSFPSQQRILNSSLLQNSKAQKQGSSNVNGKKIYKIDIDGYLMDSQNRYILSPSNSMVRVSQDQIKSMREANIVAIQQWQTANKLTT